MELYVPNAVSRWTDLGRCTRRKVPLLRIGQGSYRNRDVRKTVPVSASGEAYVPSNARIVGECLHRSASSPTFCSQEMRLVILFFWTRVDADA